MMKWPNNLNWSAELNDTIVNSEDDKYYVWTIEAGILNLSSGQLVACDPFVFMQKGGNQFIQVPPGQYQTTITLADVSEEQDRSHIREAYATVRLATGKESYRKVLHLTDDETLVNQLEEDRFIGFPVDAGTACFIDNLATQDCLPDEDSWEEELFNNDRDDCWFNLMDDSNHIREGIANIQLPLAKNGENILIIHSGWGDGVYPLVGSFDESGKLLAVHIDFFVIE